MRTGEELMRVWNDLKKQFATPYANFTKPRSGQNDPEGKRDFRSYLGVTSTKANGCVHKRLMYLFLTFHDTPLVDMAVKMLPGEPHDTSSGAPVRHDPKPPRVSRSGGLTESAMKRAFHADDDSHEAQIAKATAQIAKARKVDTLVNMMSTDGLLDVEQRKKANTLLDGFLETFDT